MAPGCTAAAVVLASILAGTAVAFVPGSTTSVNSLRPQQRSCADSAPFSRCGAGATSRAALHRLAASNEDELVETVTHADTAAELLLHPITDTIGYRVGQAAYGIAFLGLIDGGFSGDWVKFGYISEGLEGQLKLAAYVIGAVHVASAIAAARLASGKGQNAAIAFGTGLVTGLLELVRVAGVYDDGVKAKAVEAAAVANDLHKPPMQTQINSLEMDTTNSPTGLMLSTSIRVKEGAEGPMRNLLEELSAEARGAHASTVATMAVNQDPEDRRAFFVLQRFPSMRAMSSFQTSAAFKSFTTASEALLEEPMGLYLVNERSGKMTEPVYPFGPGGEGGRDDAVYSSPANLQGSQSRGMRDIKSHSKDLVE
ncbi:hypothetical protein JKP88DRAFT_201766 [Tribonema minus]|uniref:DUF7887 domain-containing protein n=1 Tax=Tribonema minus TaxID=303371 RepID=A0A835YX85_9STRA|nr:hypothetical protein JKP88DRAFT_201766 [Tribonema minus]